MDDDLFTNSAPFYDVVKRLRAMEARFRHMALYASLFWDDDRLRQAEANGDVPGNDGVLPDNVKAPRPRPRLVMDGD